VDRGVRAQINLDPAHARREFEVVGRGREGASATVPASPPRTLTQNTSTPKAHSQPFSSGTTIYRLQSESADYTKPAAQEEAVTECRSACFRHIDTRVVI
jgi:hypothetical protein